MSYYPGVLCSYSINKERSIGSFANGMTMRLLRFLCIICVHLEQMENRRLSRRKYLYPHKFLKSSLE